MTALRHAACVLLVATSLLAPPAYATSFSTDQSDLWYIPAEQGWGIQLVQRGTVIFATLFVYGPSGQPAWYTATMDNTSGYNWTGALFATTGADFSLPWTPAVLTVTPVGTMTWQAQTVTTGTLTYVVNGVAVVKNVTRQTLVLDDFSGHYFGGVHVDTTSCLNPAGNGTSEEAVVLDVTQSGPAITVEFGGANGSCSFSGTVSEDGQMGSIQGSFVCSIGSGSNGSGTFSVFEMQVNISGMTSRFALNYTSPPGCQATGWLGGMRGTTF
jgi:hypothetical protein